MVTPMEPSSCDEMKNKPNGGSLGKGDGKALMVYVKTQPAMLFRMTNRPMKTTTMFSTGAFSTGRMMMRWIKTPKLKDSKMVQTKASQ